MPPKSAEIFHTESRFSYTQRTHSAILAEIYHYIQVLTGRRTALKSDADRITVIRHLVKIGIIVGGNATLPLHARCSAINTGFHQVTKPSRS
jgi:hypothetical protein